MSIEEHATALAESLQSFVPPANCSCHISPPCGDCIEYTEAREVLDNYYNFINGVNNE